jgi:hypothetical protein
MMRISKKTCHCNGNEVANADVDLLRVPVVHVKRVINEILESFANDTAPIQWYPAYVSTCPFYDDIDLTQMFFVSNKYKKVFEYYTKQANKVYFQPILSMEDIDSDNYVEIELEPVSQEEVEEYNSIGDVGQDSIEEEPKPISKCGRKKIYHTDAERTEAQRKRSLDYYYRQKERKANPSEPKEISITINYPSYHNTTGELKLRFIVHKDMSVTLDQS